MSGPKVPACPGANEFGFDPATSTGICKFGIGAFAISVHVTLPSAVAMVSVVVLPTVVAQLGAEVPVIAAAPIATSVHVAVLSVVVAPTVVAQVGAVGVPEVPAVVTRCVFPSESRMRLPDE